MNTQFLIHDLQNCLCNQIRRTDRTINRFYDGALKIHGINAPQFALLSLLSAVPGASVSELTQLASMDQTSMTRSLQGLEKNLWVNGEVGEDKRLRHFYLTIQGQRLHKEAKKTWEKCQSKIEMYFPLDQFQGLVANLTQLRKVLGVLEKENKNG